MNFKTIFKQLNYIFDRDQKRGIFFLGIMIFIGGVLETLGVSMMLPVVAVIVNREMVERYISEYPVLGDTLALLGIKSASGLTVILMVTLMVMYILKNLYLLFLAYKQSGFVSFNRNRMISRVLREFLNRPYEFYLEADIPTVFRMTDADIPQVFNMVMDIINMSTELVVAAGLSVLLLITDIRMTVFLILVMGAATLSMNRILKPILNSLGHRNLEIQSRIAKWRIEAIYGIKDVKVLNRTDFFASNYHKSGEKGAGIARRYAMFNAVPRLFIETFFVCSLMGYIMFIYLTGNNLGELLPRLTVFGVAAIRLMPSVNRINTYINNIAYEQPSLEYLYENIDRHGKNDELAYMPDTTGSDKGQKPENTGVNALKETAAKPVLKKEIRLQGITYAYPNTEKLIFDDAEMVVPAGKSVGIRGSSGAGKSTIVDILLGLLTVRSGKITCDGEDIFKDYPGWLSMVGYIPQSIYLVDETIRDNIAFGIEREKISDDRIWEVLKEAQLADFIRELPEGLETTIGDRGVRLSGGQRQRIGIARALYHDPQILVFDEATSALDNETEQDLMDAINSFKGKKTMVIIAHRLNTIEKCDIVYEVRDGKILRSSV